MSSGYVDVPHSSYNVWRSNTLGNSYDLDGSYGCQCWDYASLFWRNVGFPAGYPLTGSLSYASQCWSQNRLANSTYNGVIYFELISDKTKIKRGDIIVLDGNSTNPPGHITFADEDYNGTDSISCLGQNQGGTPLPEGGTAVTVNTLGLDLFLGVFRYTEWNVTPPTPIQINKSKFPFVLYAKKLREKRNMI